MFWIALVAAVAQFSAPQGPDIRTLFSADDVPMQYLPVESDRTVGIRLTVRPDGRVQSCDVEYTSGVDGLDVYTCKLAKRRAKYAPASLKDGTPTYAVDRASIRWVVTGFAAPGPSPNSADLTLTVGKLPKGVDLPAFVFLKFVVDEQGRTSECSRRDGSKNKSEEEAEFVRIACDEFMRTYKAKPAKDEQGKPVPSVQDAVVAFASK